MSSTSISSLVEAIRNKHIRGSGSELKSSDESRAEVDAFLKLSGYLPLNEKLFEVLVAFGGNCLEEPGGRGLFLRGDVGIGKSFGLELLAAKFGWAFRTAREIEGFYRRQPAWEEWEEYCRAADFFGTGKTLVIDDLGTENADFIQFGQRANPLQELLEIRYDRSFHRDGVRTVVSSNLTDLEIQSRYGFRVFDRMREMFAFVTVKGESLRA